MKWSSYPTQRQVVNKLLIFKFFFGGGIHGDKLLLTTADTRKLSPDLNCCPSSPMPTVHTRTNWPVSHGWAEPNIGLSGWQLFLISVQTSRFAVPFTHTQNKYFSCDVSGDQASCVKPSCHLQSPHGHYSTP